MKLKDLTERNIVSMQVLDALKAIELLKQKGITAVKDIPITSDGKEIQRVAVRNSVAAVAGDILTKSGNYFDPKKEM